MSGTDLLPIPDTALPGSATALNAMPGTSLHAIPYTSTAIHSIPGSATAQRWKNIKVLSHIFLAWVKQ